LETSFDIQDRIFGLFYNDNELLSLLGSPISNEEINNRIRLEQFDETLVTTDITPFISVTFIDAHNTKNYLTNKGVLEILIYTPLRYNAMLIYKRINSILKDNFDDFSIVAEGQKNSAVPGIYQYCIRYKPMINS
jgi:hypothetical protein